MNILIAGDFYIADNFKNHPLIDSSVEALFATADYRIVNLEAPLTSSISRNRIMKTGPHLQSLAETMLPYLQQLEVDIVTLANNHILDYGITGLKDTFDTLQKNKISYVGAGNNRREAARPYTLEKDGIRIAILNFAENEWSIAEEDEPGANPLAIIDNVNQIKATKATHDKVICIIHGGHEYYHLPSPRMVKQYRFYAENGADAIVGHHTHCIGGYEVHKDVPIIYSLGNFLFTLPSKMDVWYTGLLAVLKFEKNSSITFNLFPAMQDKKTFRVTLLKNEIMVKVTQQISKINAVISNKVALQQSWNDFIHKKSNQYLNGLSLISAIDNHFIRGCCNRLGISKLFLSKQYLKLILNFARCEAHADGMKASIKRYLNGD